MEENDEEARAGEGQGDWRCCCLQSSAMVNREVTGCAAGSDEGAEKVVVQEQVRRLQKVVGKTGCVLKRWLARMSS